MPCHGRFRLLQPAGHNSVFAKTRNGIKTCRNYSVTGEPEERRIPIMKNKPISWHYHAGHDFTGNNSGHRTAESSAILLKRRRERLAPAYERAGRKTCRPRKAADGDVCQPRWTGSNTLPETQSGSKECPSGLPECSPSLPRRNLGGGECCSLSSD